MIDQIVIFGGEVEDLADQVAEFANLLGSRFSGVPIILANPDEDLSNVHAQVEARPAWNYRTEKVVAIVVGQGFEEETETAYRLVSRKSSYNNVIIATQAAGNDGFNSLLLSISSRTPRMVIATEPTAESWKVALDGFDASHPGWDV